MIIAFALLTCALAALWLPRWSPHPRLARAWTIPFALAVVAALAARVMDVRGVLVLLALAVACRAANRAVAPRLRLLAHVLLFLVIGAVMLHAAPGFTNPLLIDREVVSPGGVRYTHYLNFDKGLAGLLLLGVYDPALTAGDEGAAHGPAILWRFACLAAAVAALSLAVGYVRLDPKLPSWFPAWAWSMVCFTALPEEALFRGVLQTRLAERVDRGVALVIAALLFGSAHVAGGWPYVVVASVAGAGYGWIFARTRSIGAAIAAHAGLNAIHLLLFSYPALALHRSLPW